MSTSDIQFLRVLAIDPSPSGFGYVVIEEPSELIDFGTKTVKGDKNFESLKRIEELINYTCPHVIIVEDITKKGALRRERVRRLIRDIIKLAAGQKIKAFTVSRLEAKAIFSRSVAFNKHQIASIIAAQFPELRPYLPPPRKSWMPEDSRMSIFDAAALALTLLRLHKGKHLKDKKLH